MLTSERFLANVIAAVYQQRQLSMETQTEAQEANAAGVSRLPYSVAVGEPFRALFGLARSTQMDLIARGEVESRLVGGEPRDGRPGRGRRYIIVQSWLRYLERQHQKEVAGEIGVASPNPRARNREAQLGPGDRARSGSGVPRKRQVSRDRVSGRNR